jgi:hypothetical protein
MCSKSTDILPATGLPGQAKLQQEDEGGASMVGGRTVKGGRWIWTTGDGERSYTGRWQVDVQGERAQGYCDFFPS